MQVNTIKCKCWYAERRISLKFNSKKCNITSKNANKKISNYQTVLFILVMQGGMNVKNCIIQKHVSLPNFFLSITFNFLKSLKMKTNILRNTFKCAISIVRTTSVFHLQVYVNAIFLFLTRYNCKYRRIIQPLPGYFQFKVY